MEVRDKACLKCGNPEFQASHIYSVGAYKKLEYDIDNIIALCYRHHIHWWHKDPGDAWHWINQELPVKRLEGLKLRSQTTGDGSRDYNTIKLVLEFELKKWQKLI